MRISCRSRLPLILISLVLFTSCSGLVNIPIDIKKSPLVLFPDAGNKVLVVVDNTPYFAKSQNMFYDYKGDSVGFEKDCDSLGIIFKEALSSSLSDKRFFDDVVYKKESLGVTKKWNDTTSLSLEKIQAICRESGADALISVNWLSAGSRILDSGIRQSDMDINQQASMQSQIVVRVDIYSADGTKFMPTLKFQDSEDWDIRIPAVNKTIEFIKDSVVSGTMKATASMVANSMNLLFVPQWQQQNRWYYMSGTQPMKLAQHAVVAKNWKEAAEKWQEAYESQDIPEKRARIASNIAFANEMMDNLPAAIEWLGRAKADSDKSSYFDKARLTEYQVMLAKRIQDAKRLDILGQ